jgi:hypothetical protein
MTSTDAKQELEEKLTRYRELARQYFDPVSAANMRQATDELERQIRDLDE